MGHKPLKVQMMQWSMGSCCSSFASNSRDSNSAPLPWLRVQKSPPTLPCKPLSHLPSIECTLP